LRGIADEHGVQPLAHWVTDGVIYCVVQAPNEEAFCRHHADRGLPIVGAVITLWPVGNSAA
jgi:hypothetical protein